MTSLTHTTPPADPPRCPPTWVELVNQERRLLDGLVQFMRARSRRPPAEIEEIVARALEEALQEIIAEEPVEERADELRRRAAARARAWSTADRCRSRDPKTSLPAAITTGSGRSRALRRCWPSAGAAAHTWSSTTRARPLAQRRHDARRARSDGRDGADRLAAWLKPWFDFRDRAEVTEFLICGQIVYQRGVTLWRGGKAGNQ
jgi:hypothetical protein